MNGFASERDRRAEGLRLIEQAGLGVAEAAERVGRSRQWLSKWRQRSQAGETLEDQSRASATSFEPLDPGSVELVAEYRSRLEADPVASIGGLAILAAMERDGLTDLPSVRSIERILTRRGVSHPKQKKSSRSTTPVLPLPQVGKTPGVWQQADWVQDRYLEGGVRYNSIQLVDMGSGGGLARQYRQRNMVGVVEYLLEHAWPQLSVPWAISVDNAFSKTSHRHNCWTSFVRVCLFLGTEPVVSPPQELGWTNGAENFNNLWQDRTIVRHHYPTSDALAQDTDRFNHWANHERPLHDPLLTGTRYSAQLIDLHRRSLRWPPKLRVADHLDSKGQLHIPLTAGRITLLRRVEDKHIEIAHHHWPIDLPDQALVVASITTSDATLHLRHHAETLAAYPYPIRHPITDPYYPPQPNSIYHHA